jgi:hypothetical protein
MKPPGTWSPSLGTRSGMRSPRSHELSVIDAMTPLAPARRQQQGSDED